MLGSVFIAAAAIVGLRATNTKGEDAPAGIAARPEAVTVTVKTEPALIGSRS